MFSEKAGGHTGCMHVFIGADGGWGAAGITLAYSQRHRGTNYGFNLLLRFELTPLHLAAAISTCGILTISLKSLVHPCLNFFFPPMLLELTQSYAVIRYSNTIYLLFKVTMSYSIILFWCF